MMLYISIAIIALANVVMITLLVKQGREYRATKISVQLQRILLDRCSEVMGDDRNSLNLRQYVSHVALLGMSTNSLKILGTDGADVLEGFELLHAESEHREEEEIDLTPEEGARVQPIVGWFTLSSMVFDKRIGAELIRLVKQGMADALVEGASKRQQEAAEEVAAPVEAVAAAEPSAKRELAETVLSTRTRSMKRIVSDELYAMPC